MSQPSTSAPNSTPTRRRWLRYGALAAVVLVPFAFVGLFIGAIAQLDKGIDSIPAAIVNNDQLVTTTATDGTKSQVLAGRLLVTQLTGKNSAGFDWTITNTKDAKAALKAGKVFAILTVPKNFSKSITSLSGKDPQQAKLSITTDDAHNYLTGSVAQVVGDTLSSTFGKNITKQYIAGLYSGIGGVGGSLGTAADGAGKLADGATSLSSGLSKLAGGTASSASGATKLASGVSQYVAGASQVSSGAKKLQSGIVSAKSKLMPGVSQYTGGVSQLSAALAGASAKLAADTAPGNTATDTDRATDVATISAISSNLRAAAAGGAPLKSGINSAFTQLAAGAGTFATQTAPLASGGAQLASGTKGLASGLGKLADGTAASATGAKSLAGGASKLADGLQSGADSAPTYTKAQIKQTSDVVSNPVGVTIDREHEVSSPAQIIATLLVPLGLWIGSLAVFLVMRPVTRRTLSSTAGNARLVLSAIARASVVTIAQAVLLVGLLHVAAGVSWSLLPATLLFGIIMAVAFTAFHYLLTIGLGRAGLVVSIFLLALQITATGGLYPIQLLAAPFQFISPFLPLTYGVSGMQAIIANSGPAGASVAAIALVAFGLGSVIVALLAVRRVRRARSLGLVPSLV